MSITKDEFIRSLAMFPDDAEVFIAIFYPRYASIEEVGPITANGRAIQIGVTACPMVIAELIKEARQETHVS